MAKKYVSQVPELEQLAEPVLENKEKKSASKESYSEKTKKMALALAFGIALQGGFVTGIPGGVPGLGRALTCGSCTMSLSKGLPTQFTAYMSEAQKKTFKEALKRRGK